MNITASTIEKGRFVKCGHAANLTNTYRGDRKITECRLCRYQRAKVNAIKTVETKKPGNIIDGKFKACGHDAIPENVYRRREGWAQCKECIKVNKKINNALRTKRKQLQGAMI